MGSTECLLVEYGNHTNFVEKQLEQCKKDHSSLRAEIEELISENRKLAIQLIMNSDSNEMEGNINGCECHSATLYSNLKQQLDITTKERDTALEMWKLSSEAVDKLEEELKNCNSSTNKCTLKKQLEDVLHDYSETIALLESKLQRTNELLSHQTERADMAEDNADKLVKEKADNQQHIKELEDMLKTFEATTAERSDTVKIQESDRELLKTIQQLEKCEKQRDELQDAVEQCHKRIGELETRETEAREKVAEAITLVESTLIEKEEALAKEASSKEECHRLQKAVTEMIDEAGKRVGMEVEVVKQQCNQQLKIILGDLSNMQREKERLTVEREQLSAECERLEIELAKFKAEPSAIEKRLETVYQQLATAEVGYVEVTAENDALRESYCKLQEKHKRELRQRSLERQLLEDQLLELDSRLGRSNQDMAQASRRADTLAQQLQTLECDLVKCYTEYNNRSKENQEMLQCLQDTQKKSVTTVLELQKHVDAHNEIANKWKKEVERLTKQFQGRLSVARAEMKRAKRRNKELCSRLNEQFALAEEHQTNPMEGVSQRGVSPVKPPPPTTQPT